MNDPKRIVLVMWFVALALVAARGIRTTRALPPPAPMVKGSIVFSILVVLGEFAPPFAAALAVGYVVALLMVPGLLPAPPLKTSAQAIGASGAVGDVTGSTNQTNPRPTGGPAA